MNIMKIESICTRIIASSIIWFFVAANLLSLSAPAFADIYNSGKAKNDKIPNVIIENGDEKQRPAVNNFEEVICGYRDIIQPVEGIACALRMDGTVDAEKIQSDSEKNSNSTYDSFVNAVEKWRNIKRIAVLGNMWGIAGIKEDGAVVVETIEEYAEYVEGVYGECRSWEDIIDIASNDFGVFGIKADGTVIAANKTVQYFEEHYNRVFTFDGWKNIKTIQTGTTINGDYVLAGLSEDGTFYYSGSTYFTRNYWNGSKNIKEIVFNGGMNLILRDDGLVEIDGLNSRECRDTYYYWQDIAHIVASQGSAAAIKNDGSVVAFGPRFPKALDWENITSLYFDRNDNLYGLSESGKVKCFIRDDGYMDYSVNQNSIESWNGIEKLSFLTDFDRKEIIVIGFLKDGSVLSTRDVFDNSYKDSVSLSVGCYSDVVQPLQGIVCALRMDGTVAVANIWPDENANDYGNLFKENVEKWSNIKKLAVISGMNGLFGITENGSVFLEMIDDVYYERLYGECRNWTDISDIVSSNFGVFGLKTDGTVIATDSTIQFYEKNYNKRFNFAGWKNIARLETSVNMNSDYVLLGLSRDGTMYCDGASLFIGDWNGVKNIAEIDIGAYIYLVLRKDGRVDVGGIDGCPDARSWKDIVKIRTGVSSCAGLKSDGTVVLGDLMSSVELDWADVIDLYFDIDDNLFGVCKDGTVKCYINDYSDYVVDQDAIESWQEIEKLSLIEDWNEKETIVVGYKKDGHVVCTRDLSL